MDRGDILLVDLQRGDAVSGPDCKLLGAIILRYLFELMASRKKLPLPKGEHYHPFMVYIDEAHQISPATCKDSLTDARKYRLGLTLAHQFVFQLKRRAKRSITPCAPVRTTKSYSKSRQLRKRRPRRTTCCR